MSDLTSLEKRTLERLFQMAGGYVLDFSNRTFTDFLLDSVGIDPDDARFNGGSKANRLRAVWKELPNNVVAKLIGDLAAHATEVNPSPTTAAEVLKARDIQKRLAAGPPVVALEVLSTIVPDDFDAHMTAVRAAVEQGKAEEGIDRLHTCCVGYLRRACDAFNLRWLSTSSSPTSASLRGSTTSATTSRSLTTTRSSASPKPSTSSAMSPTW